MLTQQKQRSTRSKYRPDNENKDNESEEVNQEVDAAGDPQALINKILKGDKARIKGNLYDTFTATQ